ncbi:multiple sugar transport system substrate-binding protein [Halomicrobium zhouii]|uniref:Multiple sugar transport system substrate-binding protein n=1 Tax=Halomicrobium zhouii TaxID=767519 RepID=A0A1I6KJ68_9EURY|nr:extracellular solute-binding protein [Halomicrobium zhouii]SFR91261.1 multiple sugar transport system substrate-binding protein [Halomicrobium zhouii]
MPTNSSGSGSGSDSNHQTTKEGRSRRRFLQAAGATGIAGLAGCFGLGGGGGGDGGDGGSGGDGGDGGASTGGSGGGSMELSYWTLFGGGDGEVMKSIIDKFNDEQPLGDNITIDRQRTPWDDHYDRLFTSMTGGEPPDMAISHATYLRRFQDTLTTLGDYTSTTDDYVQSILDSCMIDGNQYAVPIDSHPLGLYYNMDVLNEAGVEPPFENFTEFEEACNAILENTDAKPFSPDPYWGNGGGFRQYFMALNQMGGSMFNDDLTEATFGGDTGLAALEYIASIPDERGWDEPDTSDNRVAQSFRNGNVAMTVNGTWYVNVMRDQEFEWGFQKPHWVPDAEQLVTTADSHTIVVPQQSNASEERIQASVEAAEWIAQENPEWGSEAGHLPAYSPILNGDELREADIWDKTLSTFMEMAEDDQLAYWPQLPNADMFAQSNWTWFTDAYSQSTEPEQALQQGVDTWNSQLQ